MSASIQLSTISLSDLNARYAAEGLELPYLPPGTETHLHILATEEADAIVSEVEPERTPVSFISFPDIHAGGIPDAVPVGLYTLNSWKNFLLYAPGISLPFVAFGFGGHGIASQAAHYYLATPQIIVLLQLRWNSTRVDPTEQAAQHRTHMAYVWDLNRVATRLAESGAFPHGHRMAIIDSEFQPRRFGWIPLHPSADFDEAAALIPAGRSPLASALSRLKELGG